MKKYLKNAKLFDANKANDFAGKDFEGELMNMFLSDSTIGAIIGNCPTCGWELGYYYGHNASSRPYNCRFASYTPGHIECPVCKTGFLVGDLYVLPKTTKGIYVVSVPLFKDLREQADNIKSDPNKPSWLNLDVSWQEKWELQNNIELPKTEIKITYN